MAVMGWRVWRGGWRGTNSLYRQPQDGGRRAEVRYLGGRERRQGGQGGQRQGLTLVHFPAQREHFLSHVVGQ